MKRFLVLFSAIVFVIPAAAQNRDTVSTSEVQISAGEFSRLLGNVRDQDSDALKTSTLKEAFINSTQTLTTAQIRRLLTEIPKDSDKLEIARSAYDRVSDPDLFIRLADLFQSPTYEREFSLWVRKQHQTE